jgi:hypothetical protein
MTLTRIERGILAAVLLTAGLAVAAELLPTAQAPPDLQALLKQAREAEHADFVGWAEYRFQRQERVEELTDTGQVKNVRTFDFEITPLANGFDERLLKIDGLDPTEGQIEDQRRDGRFQKHYKTLIEGSEEQDPESGYSISTLLRLSEYRDAGRETVDGVACRRLDFDPQQNPPGSGLDARIAEAMSGSIWLSAEGAHLVRARTTSVRPITLTLGLFKVQSLEVAFDAERVAPDRFLPRQLSIVSHARLVFIGQHRRRVFTYSQYAPLPEKRPLPPPG